MLARSLVLVDLPKKLPQEFTSLAQLLSLPVCYCNKSNLSQTLIMLNTQEVHKPLVVHYVAASSTLIKTGIKPEALQQQLHLAICHELTTELEVLLIAAGFCAAIDETESVIKKIQAVKTVQNGEISFTPKAMSNYILHKKIPPSVTHSVNVMELTTKKEQQIISLIWRGLTNDEMAQTLNISVNTVKMHVQNIYKKTNIRNRGQLHALAHRH
jgi:DNA-binding CsgD family transcriptional regulator